MEKCSPNNCSVHPRCTLATRTVLSSSISTSSGQSSSPGALTNRLLITSGTKDRVAPKSNSTKVDILFTKNDHIRKKVNISNNKYKYRENERIHTYHNIGSSTCLLCSKLKIPAPRCRCLCPALMAICPQHGKSGCNHLSCCC